MWKYLYESVQGSSHLAVGIDCQDASLVTTFCTLSDNVLVIACADGAGSASESRFGSTNACKAMARFAAEYFQSGQSLDELTDDVLRSWVRRLRGELAALAEQRGLPIRDFACTLLFGMVGTTRAAFVQIGDGAFVISDGSDYLPIFWPQSGEYQNTTYFATDDTYEHRTQTRFIERPILRIAAFTDGLQMLALNFATKAVHRPFFEPLFSTLHAAEHWRELAGPVRLFLCSERVNERTDDDKTLILAVRVPNADTSI